MKALTVGAILLTLVAAPVSATMVKSGELAPQSQCDLSAARIITHGFEGGVVNPDDGKQCQDVDGEAGRDPRDDAFRLTPANDASGAEPTLDLSDLAVQPLSRSLR